MISMDGIHGTNGTMDKNSSSHMTTRSVSDHTLKSVSLLDQSVVNQLNGHQKCETLHVMNGHRMPSYVGISCAISGYSDYNRYCSPLRSSCTRREISVALKDSTQQPVNHLNDSLNRKNSLISEALITSRHNLNEDIDDIQINGTEQTIDYKTNDINTDLNNDLNNKNNSLLEQRIASLYGQRFANDWRESRTKTRHKLNNSCIFNKQRSPSCPPCPPTQKQTQIQSRKQTTNDISIDTQKKTEQISNQRSITNERVEQIERQISEKMAENSQIAAEVEESQTSTQSISIDNNCAEQTSAKIQSNSERDGNWFINLLDKTTDEIKQKIDLTEQMLNNQDSLMSEEISGKLRAAIGKANLLISKKFKQFRELCLKNISQSDSEPFVTRNDDLEGFWDMVSIQVIDINDTFEEINNLYASGWKKQTDLPKKTTLTPVKARSRKSTPKGSPEKSCDESNSERDSERRNRLKEAKRRARLKAGQKEEEITIFLPNINKD